jgi:hypothetical protein
MKHMHSYSALILIDPITLELVMISEWLMLRFVKSFAVVPGHDTRYESFESHERLKPPGLSY